MVVRPSMDLDAAGCTCWLAHMALDSRDSHWHEGKKVVVLLAVCPESWPPKHPFRQWRERSDDNLPFLTVPGLLLLIHLIMPMRPENTHKLMGFYMEVLILGVNTLVDAFCFFNSIHPVGNGKKKQKTCTEV